MPWTDDRIATLKHYWTDGLSASQIAQKLGEVTRNAVIGKVHRLGLAGRGNSSRRGTSRRASTSRPTQRTPARRYRQRSARPVSKKQLPPVLDRSPILPELGPPPCTPVTVPRLTPFVCRWPEGDPKSSDFHFCGRIKTKEAIPYCDHHAAIAFR
jgi:GcrA cell cycle regulator